MSIRIFRPAAFLCLLLAGACGNSGPTTNLKPVFFRNVPEDVWRYELGGYPVLKKWLGYRDARRRNNRPLSLAEKDHFRGMVQRIAALLSLRQRLNGLYEAASADSWTVDLGVEAVSPTP